MKKLILNPKKIRSNKKKYFFLGKWFLNFLSRDLLNKSNFTFKKNTYNFNFLKEIKQKKINKFYYNKILNELYPTLNNIHGIKWSLKTWDFFIGHWLNFYIFVIGERIELVKNLNIKKININDQLNIGKSTCLTTYNIRDFTFNSDLIDWNEKLISRIIYLLNIKKFNNDSSLLKAKKYIITKNENFFNNSLYTFKIKLLKILERSFCFSNKFLFYNSYIKNKFLFLKILIKLKNFPFIYSYNFFEKKVVNAGVDIKIRKRISLNLNEKNLNLKIIKFLLVETMPTIFLEGFKNQYKLAIKSHLPKQIKNIFTSSTYAINSFKFWLAEQLNNGSNLYFGQHGAGYNLYKNWFFDEFESSISKKRFVWGSRKFFKNNVSVGNYLINNNNIFTQNKKDFLLVLPTVEIFRRTNTFRHLNYFDEEIKEVQKIIDNLDSKNFNILNIRNHPQNYRRELKYQSFLKFKNNCKISNARISFQDECQKNKILIFSYLSTEFFNRISLNQPCFVLMNEKFYNEYLKKIAKKDFEDLSKIGILFTNGKKMAKKINKLSKNIYEWWNSKNVAKIKKDFCKKYSNPKFDEKKFINHLRNN